jgi:hypothetical protein
MFKLLISLFTELFFTIPTGIKAHSKPLDMQQFMPKLDELYLAMLIAHGISKAVAPKRKAQPQARSLAKSEADELYFSL